MLLWETETKVLLIFQLFSEIIVAQHDTCDHYLKKMIKILVKHVLFSIIVFNMMKLLPILQVKASKTMIKESYRGLT